MSFADWLWSVIAPALGLKTIPDLLDTNSTHTDIAYANLTAPHSRDYMGYVRHVGHAARSSTNSMWLLGLEYAKFSLHVKWINCLHPYRTVIACRINYHRPPEITPLGLTLGFHGRDISYKIHSFTFIHSYFSMKEYTKLDLYSNIVTHPQAYFSFWTSIGRVKDLCNI